MSHQSKDATTCHAASRKLHWMLFVRDSQSVLVCLFNLLYSSTIYLQRCINFCCTARWLSYTHTYICTFLSMFFSIMVYLRTLTNLDSIWKSRDTALPTKVHLVKATVFPVIMYGRESWTIKQAESWRIDTFELWCWKRLLRVHWTARRSIQSIPKGPCTFSPEY